ncbi:S-layer protein [Corallococcus carmarthensis]|uniref:S-layer protein n=1 Tax=Corallococcus carmarthensis TaxID=2316728 RepID=UPI00148E3729|nr:S-layer protein [Corallococcus carmarthensis]NOK18241.1 S-layer protein [Corallococcus carmarthensis]
MRASQALCLIAGLAVTPLASAATSYAVGYSTYLGGSSWEHARDVVTDAQGFTYVVGGTGSGNFTGASLFPAPNVYNAGQPNSAADGSFGGCDVFITKLTPGGQVLWTKYMGGPNYDRAYAVEVDAAGNVYIAGRAGKGFPVNGFQTTFSGTANPSNYGNQNGFVAKLDGNGTVLWSTYVGTGELVRDLALDSAGDIYIPLVMSNLSSRTAFSTPALAAFNGKFTGRYKPTPPTTNTGDVGVAKLKGDGSGVVWATWLGGAGNEGTNPSIRVDANGQSHLLFVTASTSPSLPTAGSASQTNNGGGNDSYLAKLSADGATLSYGTYVGGTGGEGHETHSLALDAQGQAVIAIQTGSTNFPISTGTVGAAPGAVRGANDVAIVRFDLNGARMRSTVIGASGGENPDGIYVAPDGRIVVAGETTSSDFPVTPNALKTAYTAGDAHDGFFFVLSEDMSTVDYATYFGGTQYDNGRTAFLGPDGSVYVAGGTLSSAAQGFPLVNAYDSSYGGGSHPYAPGSGDAWVARFTPVP